MLKIFLTEDDLEVGDIIEKNPSDTVASCKIKNTDNVYCYKRVQISSEIMHTCQQRSKFASLTLINPSLVKHHQVIETNDYIIFLSEYSPLGNLEKEISSREKSEPKHYWNEDELLAIWKGMINACAYLETYHCAHRDIRPSNFIKFSESSYKLTNFLYIYDKFNRETDYQNDQLKNNNRISQSITIGKKAKNYLSPEQFLINDQPDNLYNPFKSDIYCLGKVFLHMACLGDIVDNQTVINNLQYSITIKSILEVMLNPNPILRTNFNSILYRYLSRKINNKAIPARVEEVKFARKINEDPAKIIKKNREYQVRIPEKKKE